MIIEGRDCSSHRVKITNFFEGILYIPEEMDAMDLKALTQQANHIFKMSQIDSPPIQNEEDLEIEQPIKKIPYNKSKDVKVDLGLIIELHKQGKTCRKIRKQTGYKYKQVYYGLKRNGYEPLLTNSKPDNKSIDDGRTPGDITNIKERLKLLKEYYECEDTIDRKEFAKRNNLNLLQFQKAATSWRKQTGYKNGKS
jgi:hypothetical protein